MEGDPIKQIINEFEKVGYDTQYELIKANEYGIPQTRWRVIIIGIYKDRKIKNLELNWNKLEKNKISCIVGKYFKHLKEPNETKDIAQQIYSKASKLEKGQGQIEINLESFGPTIRAEHHGNIEFRRHKNGINKNESNLPERRLTVREAGLIQTFPPNYIFTLKNEMTSYKYIGNAVPPLLSYIIADKVNELIKKYF
jgi:DNA (cytosine-5)-methyltransferase 1